MENYNNRLRIIGGKNRSRIIKILQNQSLRPTANSVREQLFNWLGQDLTNKVILDLFAGSGALGYEAESRNAKKIVLVENNLKIFNKLKENSKLLNTSNTTVVNKDAFNFLASSTDVFNIVFLDPPYNFDNWYELLLLLLPKTIKNSLIYLESNRNIEILNDYKIIKEGKSGISKYRLLERI